MYKMYLTFLLLLIEHFLSFLWHKKQALVYYGSSSFSYQTRTREDLMPNHILFTLFLFGIFSTSHACNQIEYESLLSLPVSTSSPPLNWTSMDCCQWDGISCDHKGQVVRIWLPNRGLSGSLSASLGNLTYLSHLNLSHNSLLGALPKELVSSLNHLKVLDLSYNNIIGDIGGTSNLPYSIQIVDISSNHFYGMIPSSFLQRATTLIQLNVSNNSLTGHIPSFPCFNSSFVKFLDFSLNYHSGKIPQGLGACSKLKAFRAGFNSLFGPLPSDIYNAIRLEEIFLPSNNLSGSITNDILNLTNLINIDIHDNHLSSKVPVDIGRLSKLKYLVLYSNSLIGSLPSSLANCTNLEKLILRDNFFEGNISTFNFSNLHQLTIIDLKGNNFFGNLPMSLYSCTSLVAIRHSANRFEGQITYELSQLKHLSYLSLAQNQLTNITGAINILMLCKNLSVALLGANFFHEAIPSDDNIVVSNGFGNIQFLDIGASQLTGQLPKWLSTLKKLQILQLYSNFIIGSIPSWLSTLPRLFHLDLSSNLFSGELPMELCTLLTLVSIDVPREKRLILPILGGSFWEYNALSNMKPGILVAHNFLSGNIPIEIGYLKLLHQLDLSHNNFTGNIPNQISKLINLEQLDLSLNQLSGEIPTSLTSLHFLSHFNVAYNHLQGQIPFGTQLQSFDASAYESNLDLCGPPLSECSHNDGNKEDNYIKNEGDWLGMPWFLILIAIGFLAGLCGVCGPLIFNHKWRVRYYQFLDNVKNRFNVIP